MTPSNHYPPGDENENRQHDIKALFEELKDVDIQIAKTNSEVKRGQAAAARLPNLNQLRDTLLKALRDLGVLI